MLSCQRLLPLVVLVCFVAVSAPAQITRESATAAVNDARISAQINTTFLMTPELSVFNITPRTQDGVVTLVGSVASPVERELAEDIARDVKGVTHVVNDILVVPDTDVQEDERGWRDAVSDHVLSARIRSRLLNHRLFSAYDISVAARSGAIALTGVVNSTETKQAVEAVARSTKGVKEVDNNLVVDAKQDIPLIAAAGRNISDKWIEKRVEAALLMNRHISVFDLNVKVNDGHCILSGQVASEAQQALAENLAWSTKDVREVTNTIRVEAPPLPEFEFFEPDE